MSLVTWSLLALYVVVYPFAVILLLLVIKHRERENKLSIKLDGEDAGIAMFFSLFWPLLIVIGLLSSVARFFARKATEIDAWLEHRRQVDKVLEDMAKGNK